MEPLDFERLAADFARDGFVNAGKVVEEAETGVLQEELERYVDAEFRGRPRDIRRPGYAADLGHDPSTKHFQIGGLWQVSEPFRRLIANERMLAIAAKLTGATTLQIWIDTVQYKPPHTGGPFHWHQDAPYHQPFQPADRLLGAWVALDDAEEESGCMWMVPGSHRWGFQEPHLWTFRDSIEPAGFSKVGPPENVPRAEWRAAVPRPVRAGEVHFHHALTWHGSPTNRSPRPRRGYSIFLIPDGVRTSAHIDPRIGLPEGALMTDAGPDFPILFRTTSGAK